MNGIVAQLVALAAHGTAAIAAGPPYPELSGEGNSTFRFVRAVRFDRPGADGTAAWFAALADGGHTRLRVDPERRVISAGGAAWVPHWSWSGGGPGSWSVRYRRVRRARVPSGPGLTDARERLRAAVSAAGELARRNGLTPFDDVLSDAVRRLDDPALATTFPSDLLPATAGPLAARQLVAAATGAWVFGGMGSWNDMWPADPADAERYEAVSDELHAAICGALTGALDALG